jgi:hypothetical protein
VAATSAESVPGSTSAETCLGAGGLRPKNEREYDLRKVDKSGSDESVGSFESCNIYHQGWVPYKSVKAANQLLHGLHNPLPAALVRPVTDNSDESELRAYA